MAESQDSFSYEGETGGRIVSGLSVARFAPYLKRAGYKKELAFQLYLHNARLSKAFLFPLHIVEVVLRNAIDEILTKKFTDKWPTRADFLKVLTDESAKSLFKAVSRATKATGWKKDDVVANLTFDFWSNLFRVEYERMWQPHIKFLLPYAKDIDRASVQHLVSGINDFRNRIAHHEPILKENAPQKVKDICDLVGLRSPTIEKWLRAHLTVYQILKATPAADGAGIVGPSLGSRCDKKFDYIDESSTLSQCEVTNVCAIVCHSEGRITGIIDDADIGRYLLSRRDDTGLIDLNEHAVGDVCKWVSGAKSYVRLDAISSLAGLAEEIKADSIRFALISDAASNEVLGVIRKAHRKY